jgi:hypothetical protein
MIITIIRCALLAIVVTLAGAEMMGLGHMGSRTPQW